jgi:hypothetical protein
MLQRLAVLLALAAAPAAAQQSRTFDGYEIHYNAFRADFVPEPVADALGLTRSTDRGLVNVTVLRKRADGSDEPLEADVSATATDGEDRTQPVRMRAMREESGLSYIGEFRIAGEQTYRIELEVRPFGAQKAYRLRFAQSLVAD